MTGYVAQIPVVTLPPVPTLSAGRLRRRQVSGCQASQASGVSTRPYPSIIKALARTQVTACDEDAAPVRNPGKRSGRGASCLAVFTNEQWSRHSVSLLFFHKGNWRQKAAFRDARCAAAFTEMTFWVSLTADRMRPTGWPFPSGGIFVEG